MMMGKDSARVDRRQPISRDRNLRLKVLGAAVVTLLFCLSSTIAGRALAPFPLLPDNSSGGDFRSGEPGISYHSPYGKFPLPNDPFHFLPCTNATIPPPLEDPHPDHTWGRLFDPDPDHWSWGNKTTTATTAAATTTNQEIFQERKSEDPYDGRGIYLCGYLDAPLDYTNASSDPRIVRLAVTKFQVSGLALTTETSGDGSAPRLPRRSRGGRSERTIVIEPGGPGGSGTSFAWREAENIARRLGGGRLDVLGWDPRGVNASRPAVACFPYDAGRDRWRLLTEQFLEAAPPPPPPGGRGRGRGQLELADAMNEAVFRACWERHGDLGRFVGTAFVARDLEGIRVALGEDELTGYLVSYGTGIGQTYANMFPESVGRMILDGTEYVRDHRLLGGFGWTALDNGTDAWRDGFLGECISAGPEHCALARPRNSEPVSLPELEARMASLLASLIARPIPAYTEPSGPSLVTYAALVSFIYSALYNAYTWPRLAQILHDLEEGNSTLAAAALEEAAWEYDPARRPPRAFPEVSSDELGRLVICGDAYDAPQPEDGLDWWLELWTNMTARSWVAGNGRFHSVFPCRHFTTYWPEPAEVYRGDLNHTLKHPVLLIAETYDPATPLRNGRRLLDEMGKNARLIVHHGYGHSSRDRSNCTDSIAHDFITHGYLPEEQETNCFANEKPYLYGIMTEPDGVTGSLAENLSGEPQEITQLLEAPEPPNVEV